MNKSVDRLLTRPHKKGFSPFPAGLLCLAISLFGVLGWVKSPSAAALLEANWDLGTACTTTNLRSGVWTMYADDCSGFDMGTGGPGGDNDATAQTLIVDHLCTDLHSIPVQAIEKAKTELHIGYGFTSHGSQIISGMAGLDNFMNQQGAPKGLFAFSRTGTPAGSLHLYEGDGYGDGDLDHDAGYYPNWVNETRLYLGSPTAGGRGSSHPEMNVIMWSWCGQLSWYSNTELYTSYLNEMNQLELDYPGITFVYMTGHSDGSGLEGQLHKNNQTIRQYCIANHKVLFDFYDIECYNPDGAYFGDKHVTDACNYDGGNWAVEWQNTHAKWVDWYECYPAHTEHLNGNLKAFAAWWLWARLAGWEGPAETSVSTDRMTRINSVKTITLDQNYPNPFNASTAIRFSLDKERHVKILLFDVRGELAFVLWDGPCPAGSQTVKVIPDAMASGLYFYQLITDDFLQVRTLLYLK